MKKFLPLLLIIGQLGISAPAFSGITSIADPVPPRPTSSLEDLEKLYKEIPDLDDKTAVQEYLKKRLQFTTRANIDPQNLNNKETTSIVDTSTPSQTEKNTLSAYEQIYQESMKRSQETETLNQNVELDGTFYRFKENKPADYSNFVPDFPFVKIKLSDSREIMAPAEEHLPYVLTTIKIEPTGLLNVVEEFVFVSNNENFPQGFFRILPKYSYSRTGTKRRFDISLSTVTINKQEYPYKMTEIGNYLYIEPEKPLNLPTGIYTYRFSYTIDRAVWTYENFDELYWDITAQTLPLVVGSANAFIMLPSDKTFMAQNAIVSTKDTLNPKRVTITALSSNSLGFADTEALAVGDDVHIYITLEKNTLLPPDFTRRYIWFIHDYGASLFALLALFAILLAYKISLGQIRRNQDKTNAFIKKTPAMFRLLNANVFDSVSLGAEILNLCVKNICELKEKDGAVILVKKTDNLQKLTKTEQKFTRLLFPGAETALTAGTEAALKLERAYRYLRYNVFKQFNLFKLRLNGLYLIFSLGMLLFGEAGASMLAVNPLHTFLVMSICSLLILGCATIFTFPFKRRITNIAVKLLCAFLIITTAGWLAIYTSAFYASIIILSAGVIIYYYKLFSQRNGLLKNKIKETIDYKSYLQKNPELAISARDFAGKIPYIYAFELSNKYASVAIFEQIKQLTRTIKP